MANKLAEAFIELKVRSDVPSVLDVTRRNLVSTGSEMGRAEKSSSKLGMALQQASFGAQDFLQVYGQTGLGGALRASANNWSQVLAIMNPFVGAIGGIAIAVGTVAIPALLNLGKTAKEKKSDIKELNDQLDVFRSSLERGLKDVTFRAKLDVQRGDMTSKDQDDLADDAAKENDTIFEAGRRRNAILRSLRDEADKFEPPAEFGASFSELIRGEGPGEFERLAKNIAPKRPLSAAQKGRVAELQKALAEENKAMEEAQQRRAVSTKRLPIAEADERKRRLEDEAKARQQHDSEEGQRRIDRIKKDRNTFRDMARGVSEEMQPGLRPINDVIEKLSERESKIGDLLIPQDEKDALRGRARDSARMQLEEIGKSRAGFGKTSLTGLGDVVQNAMGKDELRKNTAETARYAKATADAIGKTNTILTDLSLGFAP